MDKLERISRRISSGQSGQSGQLRTAGKIEFVKDTGPIRRDIRVKDFDWTPDSLRNLAKILWATQRSHSYAMSAYRLFSKMPSAEFSPDGMLGGRGYIQHVKEMRSGLANAVEMLSSFTDTVHDEVNGQHWKSAEDAAPAVQPMVQDAEAVKANPEQFVEGELETMDPSSTEEPPVVSNPDPDDMNPQIDGPSEEDEEEETESESDDGFAQMAAKLVKPKVAEAKLPTDETDQKQGKTESEMTMHTTAPDHGSYASAVRRVLKAHELRYAAARKADSSLPLSTLPGPRVEHIGPGNAEEVWSSDDPLGEGMGSGVNTTKPLEEDWCSDGISGYEDPTSGDESVLKVSAKVAAGYSWLPGADNNKMMPYYDRSVTPDQEAWMRENNKPDVPKGIGPQKPPRTRRDEYWEGLRPE